MKLYMYVTFDKYELPLAVADSPRELAEMTGRGTRQTVLSAISHSKYQKRSRYHKVEVEDDECPCSVEAVE